MTRSELRALRGQRDEAKTNYETLAKAYGQRAEDCNRRCLEEQSALTKELNDAKAAQAKAEADLAAAVEAALDDDDALEGVEEDR